MIIICSFPQVVCTHDTCVEETEKEMTDLQDQFYSQVY